MAMAHVISNHGSLLACDESSVSVREGWLMAGRGRERSGADYFATSGDPTANFW